MSVIQHIKAVVFHGLKDKPEDIRKATLRVFAEIDQDLDMVDFEPSSSVEEAIDELNKVLNENAIKEEGDLPEIKHRPTIGNLPADLSDDMRRPTIGDLPRSITQDEHTD